MDLSKKTLNLVLRMLSQRGNDFRVDSVKEKPISALTQSKGNRFPLLLSQRGTNFRVDSVKGEPISAYAEHMWKFRPIARPISALTQSKVNRFPRMLSQRGIDFCVD